MSSTTTPSTTTSTATTHTVTTRVSVHALVSMNNANDKRINVSE